MTRRAYAAETTVSPERSRADIETVLRKHGCDQFGYMSDESQDDPKVNIMFRIPSGRGYVSVRMRLPLPPLSEFATRETPTGRVRQLTPEQRADAHRQATRSRWRSLYLVVKAKLEAVDAGISTVEREFLADVLLPGGVTVGEKVDHDYPGLLGKPLQLCLPAANERS